MKPILPSKNSIKIKPFIQTEANSLPPTYQFCTIRNVERNACFSDTYTKIGKNVERSHLMKRKKLNYQAYGKRISSNIVIKTKTVSDQTTIKHKIWGPER